MVFGWHAWSDCVYFSLFDFPLLLADVSVLIIVVIVNSVGYFISLCVCCVMLIAWFWVLVWFWCSFILFAGLQLQVVWLRFAVGGFAG